MRRAWPGACMIEPPEPGRARRMLRATGNLLLVILPLLSIPYFCSLLLGNHNFAYDFHGWYWPAGVRVMHGLSPYTLPMIWALHYPAVAAVLFVPFALLPHSVGDWVFLLMVLAAVPATLRLLNVRDWRIYGIALLWQPVVYGWETANITLLLVLGVAATWRYRDRARTAGAILGLLICLKIFLAPLALWLLATRRYRAVVWTVGTTIVLNAIAWPLIGLDTVTQYVHVLNAFTRQAEWWGYSLVTLLLNEGTGRFAAYFVALTLAGAAAVCAVLLARRGDELWAFTLCVAASLIGCPIVEVHYLSLLLVPLALARPRLSLAWGLPVILWLGPADHPANWQRILALCLFAGVLAASLRIEPRLQKPRRLSPTFV